VRGGVGPIAVKVDISIDPETTLHVPVMVSPHKIGSGVKLIAMDDLSLIKVGKAMKDKATKDSKGPKGKA